MVDPAYEKKILGYVDILGFSNLVKSSANRPEELLGLVNAIGLCKAEIRDVFPKFPSADYQVSSFSDNVVVTSSSDDNGLVTVLSYIICLTTRLLSQGYMVRGGVVHGNIYHRNEYVVGPALVDAYQIESSIARYPRVVLSKEVRDLCLKLFNEMSFGERRPYLDFFLEDEDLICFINPLFLFHRSGYKDVVDGGDLRQSLIKLHRHLTNEIDNFYGVHSVLEKILWMRDLIEMQFKEMHYAPGYRFDRDFSFRKIRGKPAEREFIVSIIKTEKEEERRNKPTIR